MIGFRNFSQKSAILLAAVFLYGCAANDSIRQTEKILDENLEKSTAYLESAKSPMPPQDVSTTRVVDNIYVSSTSRRAVNGEPLPYQFEKQSGFTIIQAAPVGLFEIGTAITNATGIPVQFASDITDIITPTKGSDVNARKPGARPLSNDSTSGAVTDLLGQLGLSGSSVSDDDGYIRSANVNKSTMRVNYTGKLSDFLNQASSYFNVTWSYTGGNIRFFRNITRTFTVHALPSSVSLSTTSDSNGNSSSGGGSSADAGAQMQSTQSSKSDVSIKIWEEVLKSVDSIVGKDGRVSASVGTGTLTVTAPVEVIRRVQEYVDAQNTRLSRQIAISVQVLNLQVKDSDDLSLNIQGMFEDAAKWGLSFGNASSATGITSGIPGLGFGVLEGSNSKFATSNGVFNALSEKGRVSVVTTASVTTLNGIPVPLQVVNTRNYLAKVSVSNFSSINNTSQTELTPGSVTTGFNMSILPRAVDDGSSIMLQFGINISELTGANGGFDEFSSNGSTIQLPNINTRNFIQQARVPNGATLVLTGYEQNSDTSNKSGMGSADFMLLGGKRKGDHDRNIIVIMLTPVMLAEENQAISSN